MKIIAHNTKAFCPQSYHHGAKADDFFLRSGEEALIDPYLQTEATLRNATALASALHRCRVGDGSGIPGPDVSGTKIEELLCESSDGECKALRAWWPSPSEDCQLDIVRIRDWWTA